jgi:hypothetical protein
LFAELIVLSGDYSKGKQCLHVDVPADQVEHFHIEGSIGLDAGAEEEYLVPGFKIIGKQFVPLVAQYQDGSVYPGTVNDILNICRDNSLRFVFPAEPVPGLTGTGKKNGRCNPDAESQSPVPEISHH